jgi:hypothetical protein
MNSELASNQDAKVGVARMNIVWCSSSGVPCTSLIGLLNAVNASRTLFIVYLISQIHYSNKTKGYLTACSGCLMLIVTCLTARDKSCLLVLFRILFADSVWRLLREGHRACLISAFRMLRPWSFGDVRIKLQREGEAGALCRYLRGLALVSRDRNSPLSSNVLICANHDYVRVRVIVRSRLILLMDGVLQYCPS